VLIHLVGVLPRKTVNTVVNIVKTRAARRTAAAVIQNAVDMKKGGQDGAYE